MTLTKEKKYIMLAWQSLKYLFFYKIILNIISPSNRLNKHTCFTECIGMHMFQSHDDNLHRTLY
jgi:hypothetical protein